MKFPVKPCKRCKRELYLLFRIAFRPLLTAPSLISGLEEKNKCRRVTPMVSNPSFINCLGSCVLKNY